MGKKLIITEKPSVAREFASVLHVSGEKMNGSIEDDTWVITWCIGHLIRLAYPDKYNPVLREWRLDVLPFLPETYQYEVIPEVAGQYQIVHQCLHRPDIDTVYWAGDSGREGQLIEELIRMYGGVRRGIEEKRIWIDSQTEEAILNGVRTAKKMSSYQGISDAGLMRSIEDYSIGINFSRALSLQYGAFVAQAFGDPKKRIIAVGRVMSCVLAMIVQRERQIADFQETSFYRIQGNFVTENGSCSMGWRAVEGSGYYGSCELYDATGFKSRKTACKFAEALLNHHNALVMDVMNKQSKKRAPLLFNLAELQAECTKRFRVSPSETLAVAQKLYEQRLTTYPRTDARVLSSAVAAEIEGNISGLSGIEEFGEIVQHILNSGSYRSIGEEKYTDDSKIADHYAIIPTGKEPGIEHLSELERSVFLLICRRFLAIFLDAAVYEQRSATVKAGDESFFVSRKFLKRRGYLDIYMSDEDSLEGKPEEYHVLASMKQGMRVGIQKVEVVDAKTYPPKRYTSGAMILAMENAGRLIEDEHLREQIKGSGIGTSATRANIIDKLIANGYIQQNKKTQILSPTDAGNVIYEIIRATIPELLVPETTAEWERELTDIENGFVNASTYRLKMEAFVREKIGDLKNNDRRQFLEEVTRPFRKGFGQLEACVCPLCKGKILILPGHGFKCEHNQRDGSGCSFFLGKIKGKTIGERDVKKLLMAGKTGKIKGFTSCTGKKFDAVLKWNREKGCVQFEFPEREEKMGGKGGKE